MGQSYFIWKNTDCRAYGLRLSAPAPVIRPEERVEHITIPGRSGDLTLLEGEDIYNSYIQTVTIMAKGAERLNEIYNWLKGSDYVTFSGEPDKKQAARIIGAITLNKHSKNLDWWEGEVQFYCQPLKQLLTDPAVTVTSSGTAVLNRGNVTARPLIKLTASATSATVAAGGNSITVTGITSGSVYYIDSDAQEVYNSDRTSILTGSTTGAFPVLNTGSNSVNGSGWSSLEITRRERFL